MKIISKYKDYYDYLQGIYGVDEKLVLDRSKGSTKMFPAHNGLHILVICGKILEYICFDNTYYFGSDIAQFNEAKELKNWGSYLGVKPIYFINPGINPLHKWNFERIYYPTLSNDTYNIYPELKELYKTCPIFIYHKNSKTIWAEFPSLQELGVNKVISAHDMWILLSEWLGARITEKEPSVPIGDDKIRIQSAGFDLKTSFRNTK